MDQAAAIKRLMSTPDGDALKDFIKDHVRALDTLTGIPVAMPDIVAVEVAGRRLAMEKLHDIFAGLVDLSVKGPETDTDSEYGM